MLLLAYPGDIGSITLPADDSGISSDTEVSFATSTDVPPGAIGVDIFPEAATVWFSDVEVLSVTSTEAPWGAIDDVTFAAVDSGIFSCGLAIWLVCAYIVGVVIVVTKVITAVKVSAIMAFIVCTIMNDL